jgi:hypothetical protein
MTPYYYGERPVSDPWTVLGIERHATPAEARRAYLLRAQLLHPDHHSHAGPEVRAEAERAMRELNEAWQAIQGTPISRDPEPDHEMNPADCISWIVDRMVQAATAHGDPLSPIEVNTLLSPMSAVIVNRRFNRWIERRKKTLEQAIHDEPGGRVGRNAWARVLRTVNDSSGAGTVVARLIRGE